MKKPKVLSISLLILYNKTTLIECCLGGRFKNTAFTAYQALRDPVAILSREKKAKNGVTI